MRFAGLGAPPAPNVPIQNALSLSQTLGRGRLESQEEAVSSAEIARVALKGERIHGNRT